MADIVRVLLPVLLVLVALLVLRRRLPVLFWWLIGYPAVALRVLTSYRATAGYPTSHQNRTGSRRRSTSSAAETSRTGNSTRTMSAMAVSPEPVRWR